MSNDHLVSKHPGRFLVWLAGLANTLQGNRSLRWLFKWLPWLLAIFFGAIAAQGYLWDDLTRLARALSNLTSI